MCYIYVLLCHRFIVTLLHLCVTLLQMYCYFVTDVLFQVDDGSVAAHKALLMARCEVMAGMFSYNFRESSAKVVSTDILTNT